MLIYENLKLQTYFDRKRFLDELADRIGDDLKRWGRISVFNSYEKNLKLMIKCHFGIYTLYQLVYPGSLLDKGPKWLHALDKRLSPYVLTPLNGAIQTYQKKVYKRVYMKYLNEYPEWAHSITSGMTYPEIIFTKG